MTTPRPSHWLAALLLAISGTACALFIDTLHPGDPQIAEPSVVPITSPDLLLVSASTGEGVELRMALDTGAQSTTIDAKRARELGLPVRRLRTPHWILGANGKKARVENAVVLEELRIGGAVVRDLEALEGDFSSLSFEIDGVLGWEVLSRWCTLIDPERRELHLVGQGLSREEIEAYFQAGEWEAGEWRRESGHWFPLVLRHGQPFLRWHVPDGLSFDALLDTGATGTGLPANVLAQLESERLDVVVSGTATGISASWVYRVEDFPLGPWRLTFDATEDDRQPNIGLNVLSGFVVVIDGPGRAMWLGPRELSRPPR